MVTTVLVVLYYLLPLDRPWGTDTAVRLLIGLLVFAGLTVWQVKAIAGSRYPGLRAAEALGLIIPFYLLLFASTYFVMERASAANFTQPLTRTDALYFSVTVFATVGFGDITAKSETARVVLIVQMLADLALLGAGARVLLGAVRRGQQRRSGTGDGMARPPREGPPAPVDRPAGAALRWITGRGCRQPGKDVTSALRTPGADGAIPTMRQRRRPPRGERPAIYPIHPGPEQRSKICRLASRQGAACLLAGALMVRLISAFLATPRPGPATGPARHPAGLTKAQPCGGSARSLAAGQCQEHVTMTSEPSQSPVIEAVLSLEVRWIFPGQLDAAMARWFARFPATTEGTRGHLSAGSAPARAVGEGTRGRGPWR